MKEYLQAIKYCYELNGIDVESRAGKSKAKLSDIRCDLI